MLRKPYNYGSRNLLGLTLIFYSWPRLCDARTCSDKPVGPLSTRNNGTEHRWLLFRACHVGQGRGSVCGQQGSDHSRGTSLHARPGRVSDLHLPQEPCGPLQDPALPTTKELSQPSCWRGPVDLRRVGHLGREQPRRCGAPARGVGDHSNPVDCTPPLSDLQIKTKKTEGPTKSSSSREL